MVLFAFQRTTTGAKLRWRRESDSPAITPVLGSVLLIADFPGLFAPPTSEKEIVLRSEYNDVSTDMTVDSTILHVRLNSELPLDYFTILSLKANKIH